MKAYFHPLYILPPFSLTTSLSLSSLSPSLPPSITKSVAFWIYPLFYNTASPTSLSFVQKRSAHFCFVQKCFHEA